MSDETAARTALPEFFETPRLRLRPPRLEDAAGIFHSYAQDPLVTRYLMWRPHPSIETTRNFIGQCIERRGSGTAFPYVIASSSDEQLLGMLEIRPESHRANIGYVLAREYWGKGIMPEAAGRVVGYLLEQTRWFRVEAFCDVENVASARTLEKIGMSREGLMRRYIVHPALSSEPRDCYLYAITR